MGRSINDDDDDDDDGNADDYDSDEYDDGPFFEASAELSVGAFCLLLYFC